MQEMPFKSTEIERRVRFEVYKTRAANQQKTIVKKARRNSPIRRVVSCMYDFASLFGEIASDYSDFQGSDIGQFDTFPNDRRLPSILLVAQG